MKSRTRSKASNTRRPRVTTKNQQRRQKFRFTLSIVLFILGMIGIFGTGIYFMINDDYQLRSLAIKASNSDLANRATNLLQPELQGATLGIPNTSKLLWTNSRVKQILKSETDSIKDLSVVIVDDELVVTIEPMEQVAIWCPSTAGTSTINYQDCLGISSAGVAVPVDKRLLRKINGSDRKNDEALFDPDDKNVITFTDRKQVQAIAGDDIISANILSKLQELQLKLDTLGFPIHQIDIVGPKVIANVTSNTVEMSDILIDSFILPINSLANLEVAIKDLELLLDSGELRAIAEREQIERFEIVDFTTANKVFYRFVPQSEAQ